MSINNLIFLLFILPLGGFSQSISGKVVDAKSKEPLPYANIVLLHKNKGVTTSENGLYSFDIKGETEDSILISYLGYASQEITLKQFSDKFDNVLNIALIENTSLIDEVVLSVKKAKYTSRKKIGISKDLFKFGFSVPFGFESCTLIKNPSFRDGKVDELILFFKKEPKNDLYKVFTTHFRVKFYAYDIRNKKPGKLLCYEQIILKPDNTTQKINIDLKELHIKYPRTGICVGIETFNPEKRNNSKTMYLTSPNLRYTHDEESLTWKSYKGKEWSKSDRKLKSKVFGKVHYKYANPMIQMKVQFRK
tara:strand:+ start:373 stop:1290 length:918 start_codon:yes stop_codon:yes gene_type:complete